MTMFILFAYLLYLVTLGSVEDIATNLGTEPKALEETPSDLVEWTPDDVV